MFKTVSNPVLTFHFRSAFSTYSQPLFTSPGNSKAVCSSSHSLPCLPFAPCQLPSVSGTSFHSLAPALTSHQVCSLSLCTSPVSHSPTYAASCFHPHAPGKPWPPAQVSRYPWLIFSRSIPTAWCFWNINLVLSKTIQWLPLQWQCHLSSLISG